MRPARDRSGVAIFMVIMISVVIAVFVSVVIFQGGHLRRNTAVKKEKMQAEFMARGAHQHFLLKFKFLPTELYDAVAYAVGKNPYFDFSMQCTVSGQTFSPNAGLVNEAGPMFFTGGSGTQVTNDTNGILAINRSGESQGAVGSQGLFLNSAMGMGSDTAVNTTVPPRSQNQNLMEFVLNHYLLDVCTNFPTDDANGIVVVTSDSHNDKARMGVADSALTADPKPSPNPWRDPFNGGYYVRSLKILGIGGTGANAGKRYESDSVLLTTEATVLLDGQISLLTNGPDGKPMQLLVQKESKKQVTVTNQGWPELTEGQESDADYAQRAQSGFSTGGSSWLESFQGSASGRRTEIATGIYFVKRGQK